MSENVELRISYNILYFDEVVQIINAFYIVDRNPLYEVLSVGEVAEILKISLPLAYQLFKHKDFPALRIGERQQIKVSRVAFEKWLMCEKNIHKG